MYPRFQKYISFLLAILIFYNAAGYFVTYLAQKATLKNFVEELFISKKARLEIITLDQSESARYLEPGTYEIYYQDNYYDIAFIQKSTDSTRIYCYKDANEKDVLHHLGVHLKNQGSGRHKGKNIKVQNPCFVDVVISDHDQLFFDIPTSITFKSDFRFFNQFIPGSIGHPPERA